MRIWAEAIARGLDDLAHGRVTPWGAANRKLREMLSERAALKWQSEQAWAEAEKALKPGAELRSWDEMHSAAEDARQSARERLVDEPLAPSPEEKAVGDDIQRAAIESGAFGPVSERAGGEIGDVGELIAGDDELLEGVEPYTEAELRAMREEHDQLGKPDEVSLAEDGRAGQPCYIVRRREGMLEFDWCAVHDLAADHESETR